MNFEQVTAYLEEKFGIVLDWTSETVLPMLKELAHRIATYNIVKDSIIVGICGVIIVIAAIFFTKEVRAFVDSKSETWFTDDQAYRTLSIPAVIITVILVIATFFSVAFVIYGVKDLMEWIFIPEVQLFEYIKGLTV